MTKNQRKWLLYLQDKGIKFENVSVNGKIWHKGPWEFKNDRKDYIISAQPIPDIPDWRELCREMRRNGVNVEYENSAGSWIGGHLLTVYGEPLSLPIKSYRIPQQPLPEWMEELNFEIKKTEYPEWREEMTKETKPDQKEEIPHRELQIQWHKDKIRSLETGDPMRQWECRYEPGPWIEFCSAEKPTWQKSHKYRRKPRTVKYWHCLVEGYGTNGVMYLIESTADALRNHVKSHGYEVVGQVTETTVEMED